MHYRFGPLLDSHATTFRLYAPSAGAPLLLLADREPIPLEAAGGGY
jgi:hypothetical protein